jgi:diguanylate cyclase (GGDEF)-like protein
LRAGLEPAIAFGDFLASGIEASGRTSQKELRQSGGTLRHYRFAVLCLFILVVCKQLPAADSHSVDRLPTLTTAKQTHDLPATEAVRGYPVHLRGVATYFDRFIDPRHVALFMHDATGSIFVGLQTAPDGVSSGVLVDVTGVTGMGDFAPVIAQAQVKAIAPSRLPPTAPEVSLTRLLTGQEDGQWIEVEGIIHSLFESEHNIVMQVAMRDGTISATLPRESGADYDHLVDSRVKLHANAAPLFNGDGQMIGTRLLVPGLSSINIIEAAPTDAFGLPLRTIGSLGRFSSMAALPRRVHVRGRVTLSYPGSLVCIRDETHGLCVHTTESSQLAVGEMVDVVGFAETGGTVPSLSDALFRSENQSTDLLMPISAVPVTPAQALYGNHDSELVKMEGQLIGRDLAATDSTLMLASDGFVFAVVLPRSMAGVVSAAWKTGTRLRITGICLVQIDMERSGRRDGTAFRQSFRVLLRSPDDVVLLERASWWTPTHTLLALVAALSVTLLVLVWVVVLSRRLRRQTGLIRQSEERFRHMAQHDALTGLPTRLLLRDRLDMAIEKAKRSNTGLALLMLDLDNFKTINDLMGHHAGDQALKISARRITGAVRASDTVARISGDEFVVLITELNESIEAELVAAKVVAALSAPFRVGDREVPLSASVGVCAAFAGNLDADALLKSVDTAMYHAKSQGRNRFQLYTPAMARATEQHQLLRSGLEQALKLNEFEAHYQPLVNFQTGELEGFEALLRWRSKELGLIMPGDFIPIAEDTGLIVPIGEWILREACREIRLLECQLGRSFLLAVNLSPRQMQQPGLTEMVSRALDEAGRVSGQLELEITESMLMSDSAAIQTTLTQLRELGVRLAIDDFGVGFSSLSYITRFAIDRIKIDRSFIRKCMREETSLAVVRAMVAMAHGLSMTVVAEGVESAAEFRFPPGRGLRYRARVFSQPTGAVRRTSSSRFFA